MGAVCRHYPELEVNKVQNDKKRYFCDLDAIGLATKRWRFSCPKGKIYTYILNRIIYNNLSIQYI